MQRIFGFTKIVTSGCLTKIDIPNEGRL